MDRLKAHCRLPFNVLWFQIFNCFSLFIYAIYERCNRCKGDIAKRETRMSVSSNKLFILSIALIFTPYACIYNFGTTYQNIDLSEKYFVIHIKGNIEKIVYNPTNND